MSALAVHAIKEHALMRLDHLLVIVIRDTKAFIVKKTLTNANGKYIT